MKNGLAFLALCAMVIGASPPVMAQGYPTKPVLLVVPFPAGSGVDRFGRLLAQQLGRSWGQPVRIENRSGANGIVGAESVARAAPNGYTLLLNTSSHVVNASLYDKLPYDPLKDFTPVSGLASHMFVLVAHPSLPATTVRELVAFARAKPRSLRLANTGVGTPTHLAAALLAQAAGIQPEHVPFKGTEQASAALLTGQVHAMFAKPVEALRELKAKRLNALAVSGAKRHALLPELYTVAEFGYPYFEATAWYGLFGPAGLPTEISARIREVAAAALQSNELQDRMKSNGWDLAASKPEEFAAFLGFEVEKWSRAVQSAGIKPP